MNELIELGETLKRRNLEMALKRNPTAAAEIDRLKARIAELESQLAAATTTTTKPTTPKPTTKRSAK